MDPISIIHGVLSTIHHALSQIKYHAAAVKELNPLVHSLELMAHILSEPRISSRLNTSLLTELAATGRQIQDVNKDMCNRSLLGKWWNGSSDLQITNKLNIRVNAVYTLINTNLEVMTSSDIQSVMQKQDAELSELREIKRIVLEMARDKGESCNHCHQQNVLPTTVNPSVFSQHRVVPLTVPVDPSFSPIKSRKMTFSFLRKALHCQNNHPMSSRQPGFWHCDLCRRAGSDISGFTCARCDYDVCLRCFESMTNVSAFITVLVTSQCTDKYLFCLYLATRTAYAAAVRTRRSLFRV